MKTALAFAVLVGSLAFIAGCSSDDSAEATNERSYSIEEVASAFASAGEPLIDVRFDPGGCPANHPDPSDAAPGRAAWDCVVLVGDPTVEPTPQGTYPRSLYPTDEDESWNVFVYEDPDAAKRFVAHGVRDLSGAVGKELKLVRHGNVVVLYGEETDAARIRDWLGRLRGA
jgi:hypothetical protein